MDRSILKILHSRYPVQHISKRSYLLLGKRKQFVFQNEVRGQMEKFSVNEELVKEIERLSEENRRLKNKY